MKRTPVKRSLASKYILMMVVTFAATVVITRYYLEWTGYPQIGGGELHIAHLLWGGPALLIASLLPLIFANRRTYHWAAVLSGVGVGLFIDEVGKFITNRTYVKLSKRVKLDQTKKYRSRNGSTNYPFRLLSVFVE